MNTKVSRRVLARTVATQMLREPTRRGHWLKSLAAYLVEHKMADEAGLVVNDIARELLEQNGQLMAHVTSARPLTAELKRDLVKLLKGATGAHEVALNESVDPGLIGGLVARTPDQELDASVRTTLKQLATIK